VVRVRCQTQVYRNAQPELDSTPQSPVEADNEDHHAQNFDYSNSQSQRFDQVQVLLVVQIVVFVETGSSQMIFIRQSGFVEVHQAGEASHDLNYRPPDPVPGRQAFFVCDASMEVPDCVT